MGCSGSRSRKALWEGMSGDLDLSVQLEDMGYGNDIVYSIR